MRSLESDSNVRRENKTRARTERGKERKRETWRENKSERTEKELDDDNRNAHTFDRSANYSYNHFASIPLTFIFLIFFSFIVPDKINHCPLFEYTHSEFNQIYFHNSQLYYYGKQKKKTLFSQYCTKKIDPVILKLREKESMRQGR